MNFFARYGFVILIMLSVILIGMLVLDAASPIVNDLHEALSPKSQPASPPPTVM